MAAPSSDEDEGPFWLASYWQHHVHYTYEADDLHEAWSVLRNGEDRSELAAVSITSPTGVTREFNYSGMTEDEFDPDRHADAPGSRTGMG